MYLGSLGIICRLEAQKCCVLQGLDGDHIEQLRHASTVWGLGLPRARSFHVNPQRFFLGGHTNQDLKDIPKFREPKA